MQLGKFVQQNNFMNNQTKLAHNLTNKQQANTEQNHFFSGLARWFEDETRDDEEEEARCRLGVLHFFLSFRIKVQFRIKGFFFGWSRCQRWVQCSGFRRSVSWVVAAVGGCTWLLILDILDLQGPREGTWKVWRIKVLFSFPCRICERLGSEQRA